MGQQYLFKLKRIRLEFTNRVYHRNVPFRTAQHLRLQSLVYLQNHPLNQGPHRDLFSLLALDLGQHSVFAHSGSSPFLQSKVLFFFPFTCWA